MYNNQYQNQTLETAQLTNPNLNTMNLNPQPTQMGQPYYPNPQLPQTGQPYNLNPQLPQTGQPYNLNSQIPPASQPLAQRTNPQAAPINNAPINNNTSGPITVTGPTTNITNKFELPAVKIDQTRTFIPPPPEFDPEPITMYCYVCKRQIRTQVTKKGNIRALLTAIGTCYCGYACYQCFSGKNVSCDCDDYEHKCPNCGTKLGVYYAM